MLSHPVAQNHLVCKYLLTLVEAKCRPTSIASHEM